MSQSGGYYSLIQFCPDPSRLEGVNIGVVLFSSSERRLHVRVTRSNTRIRRFFGNQDWNLVKRAKTAIVNQLRSQQFLSVDDIHAYISKRANIIQLTSPRPMRVCDLKDDTDKLYDRLVGPDSAERKRRINGYLTDRLFEAGVVNLVEKSVDVQIPDLKRSIRVPYAYQNGRFNLISPVQFDPAQDILAITGRSAIEGQLLFGQHDPTYGDMRLVVVASFDDKIDDSTRKFVQKTFTDHSVLLYSFENLDPLLDDIKRSAAEHLPQSTE